MKQSSHNRKILSALGLGLLITLSGCGRAYAPVCGEEGQPACSDVPGFPNDNGGGPIDDGGLSIPFNAHYSFSFEMTGDGGVSPGAIVGPIETDRILKVRVNAGPAGSLQLENGYSNFTANYDCVRYKIVVQGETFETPTLKVPGSAGTNCQGAPESAVMDFSNRLTPGHGPIEVEIRSARYDFYCQIWNYCQSWDYWNPYSSCYGFAPQYKSMYCPLKPVFRNHRVNGTIDVEVDGVQF